MIAVYTRVSSRQQNTESQIPDLERWVKAYAEGPVRWYTDTKTGKVMERPGWREVDKGIKSGEIKTLVVWRMDRLGRTVRGLSALIEDLIERRVNFVSVRESVNLETPGGRLMANVLASMAQYETELRAERINAGIDVAKRRGKKWGGSKKGRRTRLSPTRARMHAVRTMHDGGMSLRAVARQLNMSRKTVVAILEGVYD